jgi:hypothetical protein
MESDGFDSASFVGTTGAKRLGAEEFGEPWLRFRLGMPFPGHFHVVHNKMLLESVPQAPRT